MIAQWVIRSLIAVVILASIWGGSILLRGRSFFLWRDSRNEDILRLKSENVSLKAELAKANGPTKDLPASDARYVSASVYSTYPFNLKSTLTVNAGSNYGILKNMAVISPEKIFVGRIAEVFSDVSVVQTIFDPSFEIPVRIGVRALDAVLRGGAVPTIDLIAKNTQLEMGAIVYTSGSAVPYGIPLGTISEIKDVDYESFRKATLELPYNLNDLRDVSVVINHGGTH